jgi:hypothetical protein
MFVHNLGGSGADGVGVLPDLHRDVNQRDDDGKCADDLSKIRQVIQIHGFQLQTGD